MNTEEVNLENCKLIASKYFNTDDIEVVDFVMLPCTNNANACEQRRLKLDVRIGGNRSEICFCAKKYNAKETIDYRKEEFVYNAFLNDLEIICAPKCYFSKNNTLVLEDLSLKGYKRNNSASFDEVHMKCTLKALAKFHAASIIFEANKSNSGNSQSFMGEFEEYFKEHEFANVTELCSLVDLLSAYSEAEKQNFKSKLHSSMQEFSEAKNYMKHTKVCCHGNVNQKTVMFRYEDTMPVECFLQDFQQCRYLPPAHDVIFSICRLATRKLRQDSFHDFLNYYYKSITSELEKNNVDVRNVLPLDEFEITCNMFLKPAKIYRALCCISENHFFDFVKAFKTQAEFRNLLTGLIAEINNCFLHEQVTEEDCHYVLKQKLGTSDYELISYKLESVDEVSGFLGIHSVLKVNVLYKSEQHNLSFFLKALPVNPAQKKFTLQTGAHFKEHEMFRQLLPNFLKHGIKIIQDSIPKCYFSRIYDFAVYEDLKADGYVMLDKRKCLSYEVVVITLKTMAKLHASAFILEEKMSEEKGFAYRIGSEYSEQMKEAFLGPFQASKDVIEAAIKGTESQIDLFPIDNSKISQEVFKKRSRIYFEMLPKFIRSSKRFRNTICHADLWSSNILYKFENEKPVACKLVDFQSYRYVPPTHDVLTFLYMTTDRAFRHQHMSKLLKKYYHELQSIMQKSGFRIENVLPYEQYVRSCEFEQQFAVTQTVSHFQSVLLTSEQIKKIFSIPNYNERIFFEDRTDLILEICRTDPEYRGKLLESIIDFRKLCENEPYLIEDI